MAQIEKIGILRIPSLGRNCWSDLHQIWREHLSAIWKDRFSFYVAKLIRSLDTGLSISNCGTYFATLLMVRGHYKTTPRTQKITLNTISVNILNLLNLFACTWATVRQRFFHAKNTLRRISGENFLHSACKSVQNPSKVVGLFLNIFCFK